MKKIFLIIFITFSIVSSFYFGYHVATSNLSKKMANEKNILNEQIIKLNNKNLKLKEIIKNNNNAKEIYKHPLDIKLENCINSTHPYLYSNCAIENGNDWDIEINKLLQQIKNTVNNDDYNIVNIAQSDWKKSADSDEKLIHKFVSNHQGAINETLAYSYIADIKKQRALLLGKIYNFNTEGLE